MARRAIVVRGITQGVGFRPFVYGLAVELELTGFVKNLPGGVFIEIEGSVPQLDQFLYRLSASPPPLACIEEIDWLPCPPKRDRGFEILPSDQEHQGQIFISPDVAVCDLCLREMLEPTDRRYLYPFLNCTNCGPRLTIIKGAPYDRERTTMSPFPMCSFCRSEYEDPTNRRFHAQPTACWQCGPQLKLWNARGELVSTTDPIEEAAGSLCHGEIIALKGLGGYHLACDARQATTVAQLRRRKQRYEKPFAVMVADFQAAETLCHISQAEKDLLLSPSRPIVLLRKRSGILITEEVAPKNPFLGVLLPYTPFHHLLVRKVPEMPLVMTSGNRSDEPIAYQDPAAVERLAGIADTLVSNNRPIHIRCDDSVTRILRKKPAPIRRSRGMAPAPFLLPVECSRTILAVGGQQKNTFALGTGRHAILSHHIGDLDHFEAFRAFEEAVLHYEDLFHLPPDIIAHDLHPDYASTQYARNRGNKVRLIGIQHHHAHLASCMAEQGLTEPVIGVVFDGTGFGLDRTVWGGEFLVGDYRHCRRAAHFRPVAMPGGEKAIHEIWRMGLAHLVDCNLDPMWLQNRTSLPDIDPVLQMIFRKFNSPLTSSVGRLFDAVAALVGVRDQASYEGQAAMELEWLALDVSPKDSYPFEVTQSDEGNESPLQIDTRPLIPAIVGDFGNNCPIPEIARRFHSTMVEIVVHTCCLLREQTGIGKVACSGGVFMNRILSEECAAALEENGFAVFLQESVPANDGGLCLGQLAIAACVDAS